MTYPVVKNCSRASSSLSMLHRVTRAHSILVSRVLFRDRTEGPPRNHEATDG
jgi:hypothetical protein